MLLDTLTAGEAVRVAFSVFHTLDVSSDTITLVDRDAVARQGQYITRTRSP